VFALSRIRKRTEIHDTLAIISDNNETNVHTTLLSGQQKLKDRLHENEKKLQQRVKLE